MIEVDLEAVISMAEISIPEVLDREAGGGAFPHLQTALRDIPEHEALCVRFSSLCKSNASFVDETIVELAAGLTKKLYGERGLLVTNLNSAVEFDLDCAFSLRWMKAHRDGADFTAAVIFLISEPSREWRVIGHLEKTLLEALGEVGCKRQVTAAELAESLQVELKNASTRLKRLHERALLWREERRTPAGREFVYSFWF